jgi:hypothetical protein
VHSLFQVGLHGKPRASLTGHEERSFLETRVLRVLLYTESAVSIQRCAYSSVLSAFLSTQPRLDPSIQGLQSIYAISFGISLFFFVGPGGIVQTLSWLLLLQFSCPVLSDCVLIYLVFLRQIPAKTYHGTNLQDKCPSGHSCVFLVRGRRCGDGRSHRFCRLRAWLPVWARPLLWSFF